MKKKVIATLITTLACINFTGCANASEGKNEEAANKTNQEIAIGKISDFLSNYEGITDVTRIADESIIKSSTVTSWITTTDGENSDEYCLWIVDETAVEEDVTVFFLFEQEEYIIAANQLKDEAKLVTEDKFVDKDFMDFSDEQNYSNGGFAWEEKNESSEFAYAFLNREAGYNCSSIWAYDKAQNNVSLVWYDSQIEGWENYIKYTG